MSTRVEYNDAGLVRLRSTLDELKKLKLWVGYQGEGAKEKYEEGINVAKLAAVVEFGIPADNLPERSFIRSTMREHAAAIARVQERELALAIEGKKTAVAAVSVIGSYIVGLIRTKLETAGSWAAHLSVDAIAAKGHARILEETGKLIKNLSWRAAIGRMTLASGSA